MDMMEFHEIAKKAAAEQRLIRISYTDKNGVMTDRRTEPYEIKGDEYWGWSIDPGAQGTMGIRRFKLFNITSAEITDEQFQPRFPNMIF